MRVAFSLILLLLFGVVAEAQTTVKFCDLLRNPNKYRDQQIKVRATFRYGFEWEQLYCLDCLDKGKAWLTLLNDLDKPSERAFKKMPKGVGIVNLTVTGVFHYGASYGHQNGYRYEVIAHEIRDVAVIQKGMKDLATERRAEQQWACGGAKPK